MFDRFLIGKNVIPKIVFPQNVAKFSFQDEKYLILASDRISYSFPDSKPLLLGWQQNAVNLIVKISSRFVKIRSRSLFALTVKLLIFVLLTPFEIVRAKIISNFQSRKAVSAVKDMTDISETIFVIPTADNFVTNFSLVKKLLKLEAKQICIRFVNSESHGVEMWIKAISSGRLDLSRIRISVENIKMVEAFAHAGIYPTVVPYPSNETRTKPDFVEEHLNKVALTIGVLGAPRDSKGYRELPRLLSLISNSCPGYSFVVQSMGDGDETHNLLRNMDQCTLLPQILTRDEIEFELSRLDILFLPYDKNIYKDTSSAMLMESSELGIPCIVPAGTGLAEDVNNFQLGWVFDSDKTLLKVLQTIQADRSVLINAINKIQKFNKYRQNQTNIWLGF